MQPYWTNDSDFTLYHGDSSQVMSAMPEQFDMIFADPPYFLSKGYTAKKNGQEKTFDKGDWDKARSQQEMDEFNRTWLSACRDRLKDNGTIWVCGSYHNIFSVATILTELGFKILNFVVWEKSDAKPILSDQYLNYSAEYIVWARKSEKKPHYFNSELMTMLNGGKRLSDVWRLPTFSPWEMRLGKHPTQKPLRLLYRVILSCTHEGDSILDPFAGSCTTGIAANLLGRKFVGIDQSESFLQYGMRRKEQIDDAPTAEKILRKMRENPEEITVLVNHARKETRELMVEKGICYMRAGDSDGSLQVKPGFERMKYVLLHSDGKNAQLFHIQKGKEGSFSIWTKETLEKHGFHPEHAVYYIVIPFETKPIEYKILPDLKQRANTYRPQIRPLSDFMGLK